MELVQPIRNKDTIERVKNILKAKNYRDFLLFVIGTNTGFRISDLLKLKVIDVKDKTHIEIREEKTNKSNRIVINDYLKQCLDKHIKDMQNDDYLFHSRKGINQPMTRTQAYRIINSACSNAGIMDKIGTHTLRKTFGYHHYQQFKDVAILQHIFNHSAPSVTLRYIGINDDEKDRTIRSFSV